MTSDSNFRISFRYYTMFFYIGYDIFKLRKGKSDIACYYFNPHTETDVSAILYKD